MRLSPLFYLINFQYHNYSIIIGIKFEWDEEKAALNLKKHKVSFEEPKTVFMIQMHNSLQIRTIRKKKTALLFWYK